MIEKSIKHLDIKASDHSSGIAVGKDLGHVQHLSFSMSDRLITACIEKEIWVINIQVCYFRFAVLITHIIFSQVRNTIYTALIFHLIRLANWTLCWRAIPAL